MMYGPFQGWLRVDMRRPGNICKASRTGQEHVCLFSNDWL